MHVLGTPPAFILSQDQTLRKNLSPFGVLFYGVRTTGYYCLTSYHSSIVKVLVPRAGFYLLVPSLSRAFSAVSRDKTADVSLLLLVNIGLSCGFPVGPAFRTVQLLWICFAAHLSTTSHFTTFHSSVKGLRELLLDGFSTLRPFFVVPGWGALRI